MGHVPYVSRVARYGLAVGKKGEAMADTSKLGSEKVVYRYSFFERQEDGSTVTHRVFRTNDQDFALRTFLGDCKRLGIELHVRRTVSESPMHVGVAK